MSVIGLCNGAIIVTTPPILKRILTEETMTEGMIIFKITEKLGLFVNPYFLGYTIDNTTWNKGYFGVSLICIIYSVTFV